jgi:hypothetical protein
MPLTLGSFRNVLVYTEAISTADGSDCREGVVELYHTSPKFRRVRSAANHSTNSSEGVAANDPYLAATGSKNAGTAGASFFPATRITSCDLPAIWWTLD